MIDKPNDYDKAERFTDFKKLPADGYVCKIMDMKETTSKAGNQMLEVSLDIAEGEYRNYYLDQYNKDERPLGEKKWRCRFYQLTQNKDGATNGGFKNLVECVKESNTGFEPQWGESFCASFKGKFVGVVFGEEEYRNYSGEIKTSVKPVKAKNVQEIRSGDFTIPTLKKLNDGGSSFVSNSMSGIPEGFEMVDESDLPF